MVKKSDAQIREEETKSASIDPLSYTSVPIKLLKSDTEEVLACATAFFFKSEETYFLVTNWHNVTGFHPETGIRLVASSPTIIEVPFLNQKRPRIKWGRWSIQLYKDNKPIWFIHPIYKNSVDVVAVKLGINDNPNGVLLRALNEVMFDNLKPLVGDDVFILGFPHNLNSGGNFPLWKRGSIASEPDIDLDGLPKVLVDTASRPGMSGAPVIYRRQGIHKYQGGEIQDDTIIGEIQNFVGVYSGRVSTNTELDTQLGIVWKARVVQEIINGKFYDLVNYSLL